jgi:hypothetical protein
MEARTSLSRREFLKLFQANLLALLVPGPLLDPAGVGLVRPAGAGLARTAVDDGPRISQPAGKQPALAKAMLPAKIRAIFECLPHCSVDEAGYLFVQPRGETGGGRVQAAQTLWNREHSRPWDRLDPRYPWGIVLHWYGDQPGFNRTIPGYLCGFDSLRDVGDYITRTSAHFLIGEAVPSPGPVDPEAPIGMLQTQLPDQDGTPFVASHLRPLDIQGHKEKKQYFVRALYQLASADPRVHSLLQDLFDGPGVDPNMRTIAIEITGCKFEDPAQPPAAQKIANVVAVVWALMKHYQIPASHLLGHHEIALGKPDPGKKFMALVRFLLGVKAILDEDERMQALVFGPFLEPGGDSRQAAGRYTGFVRDYLLLTSHPRQVYEWESQSNYWLVEPLLRKNEPKTQVVEEFGLPIPGKIEFTEDFLVPANHEGVDLHCNPQTPAAPVQVTLAAGGECIFTGQSQGACPGQIAMFRHCQPDGARVITVYNHLSSLSVLQPGQWYPRGTRIGTLEQACENHYLHFAVAYGSTWETDLQIRPDIPANAGPAWIRRRYLHPIDYLQNRLARTGPEDAHIRKAE